MRRVASLCACVQCMVCIEPVHRSCDLCRRDIYRAFQCRLCDFDLCSDCSGVAQNAMNARPEGGDDQPSVPSSSSSSLSSAESSPSSPPPSIPLTHSGGIAANIVAASASLSNNERVVLIAPATNDEATRLRAVLRHQWGIADARVRHHYAAKQAKIAAATTAPELH